MKLDHLRLWGGGAIAALATAFGSELVEVWQVTGAWEKAAILAGAPVAALAVAQLLLKLALSTETGRAAILGTSWIEGYWLVRTSDAGPEDEPVSDGLLCIYYQDPDLKLASLTYRVSADDPLGLPISARSTFIGFDEHDLQWINYCSFPDRNRESRALGVGRFLSDSGRVPDRYDGFLVRLSDGVFRRQSGVKLSSKEVRALKKTHRFDWIKVCLQQAQDQACPLSASTPQHLAAGGETVMTGGAASEAAQSERVSS